MHSNRIQMTVRSMGYQQIKSQTAYLNSLHKARLEISNKRKKKYKEEQTKKKQGQNKNKSMSKEYYKWKKQLISKMNKFCNY